MKEKGPIKESGKATSESIDKELIEHLKNRGIEFTEEELSKIHSRQREEWGKTNF